MSIEASRTGRVLHIALNRPEKRNALNGALCHAVVTELERANGDPGIGAIVLSGNGPVFCAGMDLSEDEDFAEIHERLFTAIGWMDKPVVAAVHGAALAGGLGLAANAHIVIAQPDARFGLTEIRIGLWPVLVFRAVSLAIGERTATALSITGEIVTGAAMKDYRLVTEIHEEPLRRAKEIADTVSSYSSDTMKMGLKYVRGIRGKAWEEAGVLGAATRSRMMEHEDFKGAVEKFRRRRTS